MSTGKTLNASTAAEKILTKDKLSDPKQPTPLKVVKKNSVASFKRYESTVEKTRKKIQDLEDATATEASKIVADIVKSDLFQTVTYMGKRKSVEETTCLICSTDFSLLLLLNDPTMFTTIGHRCMRCAAYCCYKCVYQLTTTNNACENSIGYQCGACKFYNFGRTNSVKVPRVINSTTDMNSLHPASGYSTLATKEMKGDVLMTSANALPRNHEQNMILQRDYLDLLMEEDPREVFNPYNDGYEPRVNGNTNFNYQHPGSPRNIYSPDSDLDSQFSPPSPRSPRENDSDIL